jgi:CheY-like chemotaxis protein
MLSVFVLHQDNTRQREQSYPVDILIAEDDIDAVGMYVAALEPRAHKVLTVFDGKECLKIYRTAADRRRATGKKHDLPFDVVILDYKLPVVDGMQVAKEILALVPEQRIIFATAFAKENLSDSIRELKQIVEIIQKPFDPELLVKIVEDMSMPGKLSKLNTEVKNADNGGAGGMDKLLRQLNELQAG